MAIIHCTNCGADTEHTAKFCRKCGSPVNLNEAVTKSFDAQVEDESWTRHVNVSPTAPSYLAPGPVPPAPAPVTQGFAKSNQKWVIIGLASLVVILVIALAAVLLTRTVNPEEEFGRVPGPPNIGHPEIPQVPPVPPIPIPPTPPARPGPGRTIGADLIYPGAAIESQIDLGVGGVLLKLQTEDSARKVLAWYEEKLNNEMVKRLPEGTSVITAEGLAIVIKREDDSTTIIITRGGGQ